MTLADARQALASRALLIDSECGDGDFQPYVDGQAQVGETYRDAERWTRMSILNTALVGKFSSDRVIREYCRDIWRVEPTPVVLDNDPPT